MASRQSLSPQALSRRPMTEEQAAVCRSFSSYTCYRHELIDINELLVQQKVPSQTDFNGVLDYTNLVIPAIRGLAHRDDIIVVAVLGVKGATLPEDVAVPANTRVVDFIPYDALLRFADVWVLNAGYGGFMHGVINGVPMVLGGDTEDKPEVAMRGQWAGVAHNLKTGNPTPQQVARGVEEVLSNDRYKKRVLEIKKESEDLKALDVVEKHIWEYADAA
ncbi:4'-demethylrebeccamycin synthase [Colletotrichum tanaceti]|uniref:4'-demethylrebeccamycin synthase n=1 Tax=Colletotrichum tanaceti TaxID=1306861 RepID=A0A4U6X1A0_9PEZI|nr:4'-demethylrebeccamycin synthase [Colletotrichum tanaceti]TKW49152.1 4'-demethylrebeccamycin synthase [Colletotrichum tanaceti]